MAKLRKGRCYSKVKRAYTRKSKYKAKSYIKSIPNIKIVKYDMGNPKKKFDYQLDLIVNRPVQIRHNAIESIRMILNRSLVKLTNNDFFLRIKAHPHHILRENKMLTGAGADRMQGGMQKAFGRPTGMAAQLKKGKPILSLHLNKKHLEQGREKLRGTITRLPCKCSIIETKIK